MNGVLLAIWSEQVTSLHALPLVQKLSKDETVGWDKETTPSVAYGYNNSTSDMQLSLQFQKKKELYTLYTIICTLVSFQQNR